ncbi:MAG: polysaccharide deacetylase family protein [Armatimonadota bacterium]
MYHRIMDFPGDGLSVHPEDFRRQMEYLASHGYHTVNLSMLHDHLTKGTPLPRKPVVITFDDGYEDNFTNAMPVLKKHGMTAIVFVISDWIGKQNEWEVQRPGRPVCRTMDLDQLREWLDAGLEIGAHTVSHPRLSELTEEEIARELTDSKKALESLLNVPVDFLCYPYGNFDGRVRRLASASYKAALAISSGTTIWHNDLYALRRVSVSARKPLQDFAAKVTPLHILNQGLHNLRHSKGAEKGRK